MQVAVAGSTGLIGSAVTRLLESSGEVVRPLLRPSTPPKPGGIRWDPDGGTIDDSALEDVDAVICLSGHSIGARRWTERQRAEMRASRVRTTSLLARTIASMQRKPLVFVAASASGYYGDRGDEVIEETSPPGGGFLSQLCVEWEAAAAPAVDAGLRVVWLRSGIVLAKDGGLLGPLLPLFRLGLGARLGRGAQWMPWISIEDEAAAIVHLLRSDASGPFNLCAPQQITNAQFTRAIARALHRPSFLAVPEFALRMAFGEDATNEAFLVSQRLSSRTLADTGFTFRDETIEAAATRLLG